MGEGEIFSPRPSVLAFVRLFSITSNYNDGFSPIYNAVIKIYKNENSIPISNYKKEKRWLYFFDGPMYFGCLIIMTIFNCGSQ